MFVVSLRLSNQLGTKRMFGHSGKIECTYPPSRRGRFYATRFTIGMFPQAVSVAISDSYLETCHVMGNSRFNFQSRDSYIDLLARGAWKSVLYDKYVGVLTLDFPTLDRISARLNVRIVASWEQPFVFVEFKLGDDFLPS